jgi:hypothetical protein
VGEGRGKKYILKEKASTWEIQASMGTRQTGCVDVKWIEVAEERAEWGDFFNTVTNLGVS